jgi:protease-4
VTTHTQQNISQVLRFLGRLWIIVTAVIGSLLLLGIFGLIMLLKSSDSGQLPSHVSSQKVISQKGKDHIAVINLSGEIVQSDEGSGLTSSAMITTDRTVQLLDDVAQDPQVKAVILRINSPGGAVVASDEIYQRVKKLRANKPVVVQMSDMAASGGYYIAAGADKIVANSATITGSIGVIAQFPKLSGLYEKVGVEIRTIKSGKFKDIASPNRDMTSEENVILNSMITEAYDQFVHAIADGRHMDEQKVRELADGRIYTGKQAKANGLVDELGNFDTAVEQAEDLAHISNATLIEYSNESFFESLFQSSVSQFSTAQAVKNLIPHQQFGVYYLLQE